MNAREDKFKHYDLVIYADRGSSGARRLATYLGSRRWRSDLPPRYTRRRPYFRGNPSPMVLNWGSTVHPRWLDDPRFRLTPRYVNLSEHVAKAINKLSFFQHASRIDGVPLLNWTDSKEAATAWIEKEKPVICRSTVVGSSGRGITKATTLAELIDAPLYTRYYPKTHEFRVHVFNGQVIDLTQKKFKGEPSVRNESNTLIRSLNNGWVHAHSGCDLDESGRAAVGQACCLAVNGLGLQFGAVDVLAILDTPSSEGTRPLKSFKICEINTGPGLENSVTIEAYAKAIISLKQNNAENKAVA